MKRCPKCRRDFYDDSMIYCLDDGSALVEGPTNESPTAILPRDLPDTSAVPDSKDTAASRPTQSIRNSLIAGLIGALVIALGVGGYYYYKPDSKRDGTIRVESIAVMPFINEGNNPEVEYLCQGLAESLIYRLSQVESLKVSPASSVLRYKGMTYDPLQLGRELEVNAVVVGRIIQRADNLVISAELVDVRNNQSLWGEQYDRKISDLLATQREIAGEIADTLKIQVSGERAFTKNYTDNNEAYLLHLQGRFLADKRTKPELDRAIQSFRRAIELDPQFALAYVGIADVYNAMPPYGYMAPRDAFAEARKAVKRALELDPSLAEAHSAHGVILGAYDWNWSEAEREHKRAIELAPNRENPYFYYATGFLLFVGRTDEAIVALKKAIEIEPKSINSNARLATALGFARQHDAALEQARKAFDLDPNFLGARTALVEALVRKGSYDEAIRLGEETLLAISDQQQIVAAVGYAYAKAGRGNEARRILAQINERAKTQYVLSARVARINIALGEYEEAFEWLERAYRDRDWFLTLIKVDEAYDPIRRDPRFIDLLRRVGIGE